MNRLSAQRIALYMPGLYGGGAERIMLNLAQGIAERGYCVDLVLAQAKGPYLSQVPKSVNMVDLGARRTMDSLPSMIGYLRREQPKAVLSALNRANLVAIWAQRLSGTSTPVIVSVHNTLSLWAGETPNWRTRLTVRLVKRVYHWADGIVAVSHGVADDLSQMINISRKRIQVIYNPVITPELTAKMQAPLDHPWFSPGEPPVLLAVGSLTEQKDFTTAIQAFAEVRKKRAARLLILGEGPQRSELEGLIQRLGLECDVSLPGWVDNPYAYMARAALFVLSSKWEGLPTVLIEALYCGASLIATDCRSGPREILADGRYGQLVPVGNVAALASAMENSLTSQLRQPPPESWLPYEKEFVVTQYIHALVEK